VRKPTIYDVASSANVSPSTVSRYLNKKKNIEPEKIEAIEAAIARLHYQPRKKRGGQRSMTIGVAVPSLTDPFVLTILSGITNEARDSTFRLEISNYHRCPNEELNVIRSFKSRNIDGLIIIGGTRQSVDVKCIMADTPVVLVCRPENDVYPTIWPNNIIGGLMATNHLIQQGHTRIVHLASSNRNFDCVERKAGYLQGLKLAGIPIDFNLVIEGRLNLEGGYRAIKQLIEKKTYFTAIFAANDLSAFGAMRALNDYGFKVPEDVSVIGFDNHAMCDYYIPKLTTVKQPLAEIGQCAYRAILDEMRGGELSIQFPPFEIITRSSTGKPNA